MRIVILDHHPEQAELVTEVVSAAGHTPVLMNDSKDWRQFLPSLHESLEIAYDMLIIDWESGGSQATQIVREVRAQGASLPILFIVARSSEEDIAAALDAGATDYLVRPLRRGELATRVQAQLRRAYPAQAVSELPSFGEYVFDPHASHVSFAGRQVSLTRKELEVALLFFRHLGRPLSRATIKESVWTHDRELPSRTIDTHVSRVRSKLALQPANGYRLAPVYSYGYKLERLYD